MRRWLKVIGAGICLGIILGIIQSVFRIDEDAFRSFYWTVGIAIVVVVMLFNILYTNKYRKRMQGALKLFERDEIEPYMAEVEDMLRTARGRGLRNTLKLNLSAGYCEQKQYDRAIHILEELSTERLRGIAKMVQRLNLCVCYFYTSKGARAAELYHASGKEFAPFRKSPYYGGNIAVLDMLAAIEGGQYDYAKEQLAYARETWDSPRLREEYARIEEKLRESA